MLASSSSPSIPSRTLATHLLLLLLITLSTLPSPTTATPTPIDLSLEDCSEPPSNASPSNAIPSNAIPSNASPSNANLSKNTTITPSTPFGPTYQATITGYTGNCGHIVGACGFLGTQGSYQAAVSAYWNSPNQPGQCGTCWQLSSAKNALADGNITDSINSPPVVVMVDNSCATNPADPTGSCNTSPSQPKDRWGSDVGVDLCADTGAADKVFGRAYEGTNGGIAVGVLRQVDCGGMWRGEVDEGSYVSWTGYRKTVGSKMAVEKVH